MKQASGRASCEGAFVCVPISDALVVPHIFIAWLRQAAKRCFAEVRFTHLNI